MSFKSFVANQFRKPSGFWGKLAVNRMMKHNPPAINWAIESSQIKNSDVVLEIGFGHGLSFEIIAQKTQQKIYGLDFSSDMIKLASERNYQLISSGKLELKQGDAANTAFEDNYFDKIIAVNVVYFWNEPQRELRELNRILKPEGRIVFYMADKTSLEQSSFAVNEVFKKYTAEEFASVIKQAGFEKVSYTSRSIHGGRNYLCHCFVIEK